LSPTRAEHVAAGIGDEVDLILDGGPTEHGLESTIVALDGRPELLRPGAIESEAVEAVVGPLDAPRAGEHRAPGMLARHYAPATPVRLIEPAAVPMPERARAAALALCDRFEGYSVSRRLSASGDLREAAARFFEILHELDALALDRIDVQPIAERGLGRAMMDRLRRAAADRRL
jgi:L-threonylcarbamoyladenylate synthase